MTISDLDVFVEKTLSPVISRGPRPCFEGCSAARRGVRGPEDAVRPRTGGGTLKIAAALIQLQMTISDLDVFFEKALSPVISSGRRRPAPLQIVVGPAIGVQCPRRSNGTSKAVPGTGRTRKIELGKFPAVST